MLLCDRDVAGLSDKQFTALRGKDIAMVFQEPGAALDPLFTVGYQISEPIRAHTGMKPQSGARPRCGADAAGPVARPRTALRLLPA